MTVELIRAPRGEGWRINSPLLCRLPVMREVTHSQPQSTKMDTSESPKRPDPTQDFTFVLALILGPCLLLHFAAAQGFIGDLPHASGHVKKGRVGVLDGRTFPTPVRYSGL